MLKTLIVFLIIFSIIVVIHEFGHFYFARKSGILVREFAIGMGPKLFAKQGKDGVMYTIRMLPLGGYVRLAGLGEDDDVVQPGMTVGLQFDESGNVTKINTTDKSDEDELPVQVDTVDLCHSMSLSAIPVGQTEPVHYQVAHKARIVESDGTSIQVAPYNVTYNAASPWKKMLTNIAGPMNNFILSIVVFMAVGLMLPLGVENHESYIGEVVEGQAAEAAGLQAGDHIVAIDGTKIETWQELTNQIVASPNQERIFTVERDEATQDIKVRVASVMNEQTKQEVGRIGIYPARKTGLVDRLLYGFTQTWAVITQVIITLASIFKNGFNINMFGGPVALAQTTGEVVQYGLITTLAFMAAISANLGIINLLPIPAFDGGKIVLNAIEALRGKPLSQEKEGIVTLIGVIAIVLLMVAVTWNDISRLFR